MRRPRRSTLTDTPFPYTPLFRSITVTGTVPDVRDPVRRAAASVAPLAIARGTQNKILECMAMGVPVVASWQAAGGVDAVPGEHILVARSAEDYAEKLLRLMDDGAARRALANAGRAPVVTNHRWGGLLARLDRLIDDCLQRRGSAEQRLA